MKFFLTILVLYMFKLSIFSEEMNYIDLVVEMEKAFVMSIPKEHNLSCVATHGSLMSNIQSLAVEFDHKGVLSKNEMRKLLVLLVNEYLNKINSNDKIKPFMNEFPFNPENIGITIYAKDPTNLRVFFPDIAVGSANYGSVNFKYNELNVRGYKQRDTETFEEAEAIVESQK